MHAAPLFSVITVTRNNEEGLCKTWESLESQSFNDYEWIVVDGASTDGTLGFLKDKPALLISEPDRGIYDAMNKGIDRAAGTYLIFMNAGDAFAAGDVLDSLYRELRQAPAFLYADSYEAGTYKGARSHDRAAWGMFTHHQAMVYSRTALGELRYDLSYSIAADYDLTLRFLKGGGIKAVYWPHPLCVFEPGGISQQKAAQGRREQFLIRRALRAVSSPVNWAIRIAQAFNLMLRRFCPALYWLLKRGSSGNTASG